MSPITGRADLGRQIHDFADLRRVGGGQRAAEDREILREHEHAPAVDRAVTGDDAVAEHLLLLHVEVGAAMRDEAVDLDEASGIEQEIDALARRQLARRVLPVDAVLAAAFERLGVERIELRDEFGFVGHWGHSASTSRAERQPVRRETPGQRVEVVDFEPARACAAA